MKKSIIIATTAIIALLTSCNKNPNFTVQGTVTDAEGQTLYLENITLSPVTTVDSVILPQDGKFCFKHTVARPPQFYRLRLGDNSVNMVIDTTATITYTGKAQNFATNYQLDGSEDCRIMRHVSLAGVRLKEQINQLFNNPNTEDITTLRQAVSDSLALYKEEMTDLVLQAPSSPVAYYILMQQINGQPIFDTFDPADNRLIAAAATAHDVYAPEEPRTQYLHNLALQGIAARRTDRQEKNKIDTDKIQESNFIDIARYDLQGNERKLSDATASNRVVLLDFTAYQTEYSPDYNMALGTLYEKYHSKGLEIYQVSFDYDEHIWKVTADNLPWICVHDAANINSTLLQLYNIQALPACYIIVDNGEQFLRPSDVDDLKRKLSQILG